MALIEEVKSDNNRDGADDTSGGNFNKSAINDGNHNADTSPPRGSRSRGTPDESNYDKLLERALAYSRTGADGAGSAGSGLSFLSGVQAAGEGETWEIRATAGALVRRLIVEKQECLRTRFHKIPFMPQARRLVYLCSNSISVFWRGGGGSCRGRGVIAVRVYHRWA